MMKRVKITVLKTTLDKELAGEYGIEGLTACPVSMTGMKREGFPSITGSTCGNPLQCFPEKCGHSQGAVIHCPGRMI